MNKRMKLAKAIISSPRIVTWNSPNGPREVTLLRIHAKSARILYGNKELKVPVAELQLNDRWKARWKPEK